MPTYRGTIEGFAGSWGSGLGYLLVSGRAIPCDNGQTVRSLDDAFPGAIGAGHCVDNAMLVGKEIAYSVDGAFGLLEGFTPYDEWLEAGRPEIPVGGSIEFEPEAEVVQ